MRDLPAVPALKKLFGPSFILLGLGLGSGEIILWPYLTSKYGLGLVWAAVIGITLQFFLNMEIERYTLARGESVFVGFSRRFGKLSPLWFIFSSLIPWVWPGIISASGILVSQSLGLNNPKIITIILLLSIGLIYSSGSVIYKIQERLNKLVIFLGVPFIFILTFLLARPNDYLSLAKGLAGWGEGFFLLPAGISIASFLGAMVYAGAGGNLNLAQSYYTKEKGYGMGSYAQQLGGLFQKNDREIDLSGTDFPTTGHNLTVFTAWWRKINLEHAVIFWATGTMTILVLCLLSFTVTRGQNLDGGLSFILNEAKFIGQNTLSFLNHTFLFFLSLMLLGTQFAVYGSTSRIMAENSALIKSTVLKSTNYSKAFFIFLWLQITLAIAILLFGFTEPLTLITLSAVLNAFTMFIYGLLILVLNHSLHAAIRPNLLRKGVVLAASLFYGLFFILTLIQWTK